MTLVEQIYLVLTADKRLVKCPRGGYDNIKVQVNYLDSAHPDSKVLLAQTEFYDDSIVVEFSILFDPIKSMNFLIIIGEQEHMIQCPSGSYKSKRVIPIHYYNDVTKLKGRDDGGWEWDNTAMLNTLKILETNEETCAETYAIHTSLEAQVKKIITEKFA